MKELKENSIRIPGVIVVCWPQYDDEEETVDMTDTGSKFDGCYAVNNSTICFVINHEVFVTPYTRESISSIQNAGLVRRSFYVPFSNGDYPKYKKTEWQRLLNWATRSYECDYEESCANWCDKHAIGVLGAEVLNNCLRIPRSGVPVKHQFFENTYYPACNESCLDCVAVDKLGCYCTNNGKVVFIYRDGHTYVTKGYWILEFLRQAGYKERGLFVPFSNGEQITDFSLALEWAQISKK